MANKRKNKAQWTERDEKVGFRVLGVNLSREEFDYIHEIAEINNTNMSSAARDIFLHSRKNVVNYSLEKVSSDLGVVRAELARVQAQFGRLEKLVGKETV